MTTFPVSVFEELLDNTCTAGKIRIRQLIELSAVNGHITVDAKLVGQYICLDEWTDLNEVVEWINEGFTDSGELDQALRFAIVDFIADMEDAEDFDLPVSSGNYNADLATLNYALEKGLVENALYMYTRADAPHSANWPGLLKNLFDGDISVTDLATAFDKYGERVLVIASERVPPSTQKAAMQQIGCHVEEIVQYVGFDNLTHDELMDLPAERARNIITYGERLSLDDYYVLLERVEDWQESALVLRHLTGLRGRLTDGHRAIIAYIPADDSRVIGKVSISWDSATVSELGVSVLTGAGSILAMTDDGRLFNQPTVSCQVWELPRNGNPNVLYYILSYSQTFDGFIKQWIAANPECRLVLDTPMADNAAPRFALHVADGEVHIRQC